MPKPQVDQYDQTFQAKSYNEKEVAIFSAVAKLINQGYKPHSLKMSEIAIAAGIGKGTAYEYFQSKQELIQSAIQYHLIDECRRLSELLQSHDSFQIVFYRLLDFVFEMVQSRIPNVWALIGSLDQNELTDSDTPTCQFCNQMALYIREQMEAFATKGVEEQFLSDKTEPSFRLFVMTGAISSYVQTKSHHLMLSTSTANSASKQSEQAMNAYGNEKEYAWLMICRALG